MPSTSAISSMLMCGSMSTKSFADAIFVSITPVTSRPLREPSFSKSLPVENRRTQCVAVRYDGEPSRVKMDLKHDRDGNKGFFRLSQMLYRRDYPTFIVIVCALILFASFIFMKFGIICQDNKPHFAIQMKKQIKICCMVLTTPKYFLSRAKAVNETWGSRCDKLYFISELQSNNTSTFGLNIPRIQNLASGYNQLSLKSRLGFAYMYKNCRFTHDWFIKADDDTYVIVEHLKNFLRTKDTSEPVTFGYSFSLHAPQGFHSGGASYVLSKEALKRFYNIHSIPKSPCHRDGPEDVVMARCLRLVKVYPGNSVDSYGRDMFHPYNFSTHFSGPFHPDMIKYAANPLMSHFNCCSDETISLHYVTPGEMYFIEFLLYKLRPPSLNTNR